MADRYAAGTDVPTRRSIEEIERILRRWGATKFAYAWETGAAYIVFELETDDVTRRIRLHLPLPDRGSAEFTRTSRNQPRTASAAENAYEQAVRQRWRALALIIKAKLAAIDAGIVSVDDEWLAYTLLPDGSTVGDWAGRQLDAVYDRGEMPALLPGTGGR